jgi:quercetin dioxygenase-like cupin family protein
VTVDERLTDTLRSLGFAEQALRNEIVEARKGERTFARMGGGILVTFMTYPSGEIRESHSHPEFRITFVRSGQGVFDLEGAKKEVASGDVIVTLPNQQHALAVKGEKALGLCELVIDSSLGAH